MKTHIDALTAAYDACRDAFVASNYAAVWDKNNCEATADEAFLASCVSDSSCEAAAGDIVAEDKIRETVVNMAW